MTLLVVKLTLGSILCVACICTIQLITGAQTLNSPRARVTARKEHVVSNQTGDLSSQEDKTEISMDKASSQSVKQLMFLHIPKTGGSSIESSAAKGGHSWGYCLFQQGNTGDKQSYYCPPNKRKVPRLRGNQGHAWWHYPVQYLPMDAKRLYENATLFAVVRNPYSRAVSEYYYACGFRRYTFGYNINSPAYMNRQIASKLQEFMKCPTGKNSSCPFLANGHFIPQYDYLFDDDNNNNGREQIVTHVLHMENLQHEFEELMNAYGLNVNLTSSRATHNRKKSATLGVDDLTTDTIDLINKVYAKDFEIGGYKMVVHS
jgi:hypothetical protein